MRDTFYFGRVYLSKNPSFNDPETELLETLCVKVKNLETRIFSFSLSVFYSIKDRIIIILTTLNFSYANAFHSINSKILEFCKKL